MDSWRQRAVIAWALVGIFLLLAAGLWVLGRVISAFVPFFFSLVVVLLLKGPVKRLEARGVPRWLAVIICYIISLAALTVFALFIVPPVAGQFRDFAEEFPHYYDAALRLADRIQTEYLTISLPDWVDELAQGARSSIIAWLAVTSRDLAQLALNTGGQILGFVLNLFFALMLAFFVLRDLPTLKSEVLSLPGPARREELLHLVGDATQVLEGFLRGQGLIALIIGTVTAIGLAVLGVPYALLIGIIAGVTNLIPYLGPVVGGTIAAISAAFVSPQLVLWTVLYIVAVQQLESTFLSPVIMADQVHLHPVSVILSLLIGATLGGIVGMLIAVPLAAVSKVVFVYYYEKWTESSISSEDGALFRKRRRAAGDADSDASCASEATEQIVETVEARHQPPTHTSSTDETSEGASREGS
jgi:predicted PurR-regulated permease PerM